MIIITASDETSQDISLIRRDSRLYRLIKNRLEIHEKRTHKKSSVS